MSIKQKIIDKIITRFKYVKKSEQALSLEANNFSLMGDFQQNDVFIVGYPKSGHTWMQNIIAALVFQINPMTMPDKLVQELVPDIYHQNYLKRYWDFGFFKSHELPNSEYKKVIYLIRDGRDVMVSYYHYLNNVENRTITLKELINKKDIFPCKWHQHVNEWAKNPYNSDILYIRYEDILKSPIETLKKISAFLDIKRDLPTLEMVAEGCSFTNMKARNKRFGWGHKIINDNRFLRKGKTGDYLNEMPLELQQRFEQEAKKTLLQFGYTCD